VAQELLQRLNYWRALRKQKGEPLPPLPSLADFTAKDMKMNELYEAVACLHPAQLTIHRTVHPSGKVTISGGSVKVYRVDSEKPTKTLQRLLGECLPSAAAMESGVALDEAISSLLPKLKAEIDHGRSNPPVLRSEAEAACIARLLEIDAPRAAEGKKVHGSYDAGVDPSKLLSKQARNTTRLCCVYRVERESIIFNFNLTACNIVTHARSSPSTLTTWSRPG
jgi:hypothetical protein